MDRFGIGAVVAVSISVFAGLATIAYGVHVSSEPLPYPPFPNEVGFMQALSLRLIDYGAAVVVASISLFLIYLKTFRRTMRR
jgi:hypothetical protein